jgi:hypothetical protein
MKKENKKKSPYGGEKRFTFDELGPIYIDRDGVEITCEPSGFAFYTLDGFKASFHAGIIHNFNASDQDGNPVELTGKEKDKVSEEILDCLDANADLNLL